MRPNSRIVTEGGQSMVEFALVLPIFLLVVLGLFDLGRAVYYHSTMSNASREAVRLAIVDQNVPLIEQRAVDTAVGVPISVADVSVEFLAPDLAASTTCSAAPHDIGCVVAVEITHTFQPATPFVGPLSLRAETHQPIERRYATP